MSMSRKRRGIQLKQIQSYFSMFQYIETKPALEESQN